MTWTAPPELVEKMKTALSKVQRPIHYDDGSWSSVEKLPSDLLDQTAIAALSGVTGQELEAARDELAMISDYVTGERKMLLLSFLARLGESKKEQPDGA